MDPLNRSAMDVSKNFAQKNLSFTEEERAFIEDSNLNRLFFNTCQGELYCVCFDENGLVKSAYPHRAVLLISDPGISGADSLPSVQKYIKHQAAFSIRLTKAMQKRHQYKDPSQMHFAFGTFFAQRTIKKENSAAKSAKNIDEPPF